MQANDQGSPPKTKEARVVVVFKRDQPPRLENLPRAQAVSENARNDTVVYRVQGRDDDKQVKLGFRDRSFIIGGGVPGRNYTKFRKFS